MATRSGGGKLLRKPKPGYDQEFTLPRGTSAAPIKQVKPKSKTKKLIQKIKEDIKKADKIDIANKELMKTSTLLKASAGTSVIAAVVKAVEKKLKKKEKKLEKNKGGSVNSRAIAKKYFKGGLV
jgi:hypothetical protein